MSCYRASPKPPLSWNQELLAIRLRPSSLRLGLYGSAAATVSYMAPLRAIRMSCITYWLSRIGKTFLCNCVVQALERRAAYRETPRHCGSAYLAGVLVCCGTA